MAKKNTAVELFVIADRSGSMHGQVVEAVNGFNTFVKEQQALPGAANLSLVLYDNAYELFHDRVALKDIPALTVDEYAPNGMTATYDAVGRSLAKLEELNPEKAVIMIITDGGENASREYTKESVAAKVKAAEDRGWEIIFLAQNMDANAVGSSLGMTRGITMNLCASAKGMHEGYAAMNATAMAYRSA